MYIYVEEDWEWGGLAVKGVKEECVRKSVLRKSALRMSVWLSEEVLRLRVRGKVQFRAVKEGEEVSVITGLGAECDYYYIYI